MFGWQLNRYFLPPFPPSSPILFFFLLPSFFYVCAFLINKNVINFYNKYYLFISKYIFYNNYPSCNKYLLQMMKARFHSTFCVQTVTSQPGKLQKSPGSGKSVQYSSPLPTSGFVFLRPSVWTTQAQKGTALPCGTSGWGKSEIIAPCFAPKRNPVSLLLFTTVSLLT